MEEAKALAKFCLDHGLIVLVCGIYGSVLRIMPPLVITDEQLDKGLSILEEGLVSIRK